MFNNGRVWKKKIQLISWFDEDLDFPIIIRGDKLAKVDYKVPTNNSSVLAEPKKVESITPNVPQREIKAVPLKKLNKGLIFWKESCGARTFVTDNYVVNTDVFETLSLNIIWYHF